jgi:mono/diheme cytochrome c family protein
VRLKALIALGATLGLAACDSGTEDQPQVGSTRAVMRPHLPMPDGTVPRGAHAFAAAIAPPGPTATPELLRGGQERFLVFCSPCHGAEGRGNGPVVSRGFPAPPSYYEERLREASAAYIVSVITNGKGRMYPYAERVPPRDRWAIAYYIKTLQAGTTRPPADAAAQP